MYVYGACLFLFICSDCVGVCGMFIVQRPLLKIVDFSLRVLKYVVCLCKGCAGWCRFCLYYNMWSCSCSCMGSMSVSSCRCCMIVYCVHPVAFLNNAFCMTCSLLMLIEDLRGDHIEDVTPTHTTHSISSTAHTYAPRCHPWICGQTPLE